MFDRFTQSGHEAMTLAHEEARELGHDYLGTEHLLLGALSTATGSEVLGRLGLSIDGARSRVADLVGSTPAVDGDQKPSTPRAMDVLVLAWQEARSQNEIGPQHILLALLREGQGVAAHVMTEAGITEERVRAELGGR